MSLVSRLSCWTLLGAAALTLAACGRKADKAPGAVASAVASGAPSVFKPAAPVASGLPGAAERVSKAVNPENLPVYTGPTGGVLVTFENGETINLLGMVVNQLGGIHFSGAQLVAPPPPPPPPPPDRPSPQQPAAPSSQPAWKVFSGQ